MLPRLQLFEWNDQPWLPEPLRRAETEYLATVLGIARPFAPLAPRVAALAATCSHRVVDLASGSGGPWRTLHGDVAAAGGVDPRVTLTDLYPNTRVGAGHYEHEPVDARAVPSRLSGLRTMFDGFHHLRPDDARAVLADAHHAGAPIVVAEATNRRVHVVAASIVIVPLLVFVLTPLIRPFSVARLVLTYVLPILPLLIVWDGVVSCLRTYRPDELMAMTRGLDGFRWSAGETKSRGSIVTYLIGEPLG
jgi:hypothetical protein